jgi:phenylpyruvate tautomerase PptA (4-oxalocrotonate tautomerase family)
MPPRVITIKVPSDAKNEDVKKAVIAKLTRRTTSLLRKNREVVLSIFVFERAQPAVAKKADKS